MNLRRKARIGLFAFAGLTVFAAIIVGGLAALDRAHPPPLDEARSLSAEVLDRDGHLLRAFAAQDQRWRFSIDLDEVDPQFLNMLVHYEDQRFWSHPGVDLRALLRAAGQLLLNGRIISGGSTITMQLARLIEPRKRRSFGAKLHQIARALQIERRLDKRQILQRYLTLAPYGGNLEGIRAASLAYFGKSPRKLTLSQSALLVALPQLPERRRPDRHPGQAKKARDRVLARMALASVIETPEIVRASSQAVPAKRYAMPAHAAHLAGRLHRGNPDAKQFETTLKRGIQASLEAVAKETAERVGTRVSVAMILADGRTGDILARVGSAGYFDSARAGSIDMTDRIRSPGSTLKPFIYGLALEEGLVSSETLIDDRPANFAGYRPRNFDLSYQGEVSVRQALQMSLNVPAVRLLDAVGPGRLFARFRRAGVVPKQPRGSATGLAVGLGGVGLSLADLVQLYSGFVNHGYAVKVRDRPRTTNPVFVDPVLQAPANWHVGDILSGVAPPTSVRKLQIAYKTGTSYGYRDAWAVGFDGRHVLGVWIGRPDNGSIPGMTGYGAAAPALFEAFSRSGLALEPMPAPPRGVERRAHSDLPHMLKRFSSPQDLPVLVSVDPAPQIVYPPAGARVDLGAVEGQFEIPLVIKIQGGRAPFRWLANGAPLPGKSTRRTANWLPDGAGYSTVTVIDANGRAASVDVFIE